MEEKIITWKELDSIIDKYYEYDCDNGLLGIASDIAPCCTADGKIVRFNAKLEGIDGWTNLQGLNTYEEAITAMMNAIEDLESRYVGYKLLDNRKEEDNE